MKNKAACKTKIDPAFEKLARIYVDFMVQLERSPMEGQFSFPPGFIEPIIQKSGWQGPYDSELSHGMDLFSFIAKTGAVGKKELTPFFKIISLIDTEDHKSLFKNLSHYAFVFALKPFLEPEIPDDRGAYLYAFPAGAGLRPLSGPIAGWSMESFIIFSFDLSRGLVGRSRESAGGPSSPKNPFTVYIRPMLAA